MSQDQPKPSEQKPSEVLRPSYDALSGMQAWASPELIAASRKHVERLYDYLDSHHAQLSDLAGIVRLLAGLACDDLPFGDARRDVMLRFLKEGPKPEPREEWPKWTKIFAPRSGEQTIYRYDKDGTCSTLHSSGIWGTCNATRDSKEVDVTLKEAIQINPAIAKTHPLPDEPSCPPHDWQHHPDASGNNDAHWTCRQCGARTDRRPVGKAEAADPDISGATGSGRVITPSPTGDEAGEFLNTWLTSQPEDILNHGWRKGEVEAYATAYAARRTWEIQEKCDRLARDVENEAAATYRANLGAQESISRAIKAESALSAANRRVGELESRTIEEQAHAWERIHGSLTVQHNGIGWIRAGEKPVDAVCRIVTASASKDAEIKRLKDKVDRLWFLIPSSVRYDEPAKSAKPEGKEVEG